jgi:hypothetical protein
VTYVGECTHEVLSYVDAENSFGAKIRSQYYAKLKNDKGTDNWQLITLKMEGQ